ncbi:MAG: hypothetical protein M3Z20_03735 [Chloroflexota bacterium]|nr:hypothetical protein [Chloroflexota bacterium]
MDPGRFDRMTRTWTQAGPRRPVLGLLASGAAGIVTLSDGTAKKRKKKKKVTLCLNGQTIKVPKKKRGSYASQGATAGACGSGPCVGSCDGKACGANDGCGGTCGCPAGQVCAAGSCRTCTITCNGTPTECGASLQTELARGGTVYACPGRYTGTYFLETNVTLIGAGQGNDPATSTILDGNAVRRVIISDVNVTSIIENVRVIRDPATTGGGISNAGTMTLRRSTVTGHRVTGTAGSGAGVRQSSEATGPLTLTDCTVANNRHDANGGGIAQTHPTHALTLTNCVVTDNHAGLSGAGNGGGVFCLEGAVHLTGGSITGNHAVAGGGIWANSRGNVALDSVTLRENEPTNCVGVAGCSS